MRSMAKCNMQQIINERLVDDAQLSISNSRTGLDERSSGLVFAPFRNVQSCTVSHYAFERTVTVAAHIAQFERVAFNHFIEVAILYDQALHERFQAQHFCYAAMPELT